jgi:hypothetical protein
MTSQENELWRLSGVVKFVHQIMPDGSLRETEVNRARFTVLCLAPRPDTQEVVPCCEFYSNALDGARFFVTRQLAEHWDALVERA